MNLFLIIFSVFYLVYLFWLLKPEFPEKKCPSCGVIIFRKNHFPTQAEIFIHYNYFDGLCFECCEKLGRGIFKIFKSAADQA